MLKLRVGSVAGGGETKVIHVVPRSEVAGARSNGSKTSGPTDTFTTTCVAGNLFDLACDLSRKPMW